MNSSENRAIWIAAPSGRCGTNYLAQLLVLHPRCRLPAAPFHEHHFLLHSPCLVRYATELQGHYEKLGFDRSDVAAEMILRGLGHGLTGLVTAGLPEHDFVVLKAPGTGGIANFPALFPQARPLIIVRDPRCTIESLRRSFGGDLRGCAEHWRDQALALFEFMDTSTLPHLLVRYEQLYVNPRESMEAILAFLELDPRVYDFEAADTLPVRGSSVFGREGGEVHWKPVPRTPEFDPLARTAHWSETDYSLVGEILAEPMLRFGYDFERPPLSFAELNSSSPWRPAPRYP